MRRAAQVFRKLSLEDVLGALSISRSGGLERNTGVVFFFFNSSNEKRPTQLLCVRWLEAYALRFRVFARLFADLFACAFKRDRMSAALYAYASVS